ncbi:MAG: LysM domain-containing protein [Negativicutes bacterium]|nr:LysM domain-containing protein [Negativicutes bacterium]
MARKLIYSDFIIKICIVLVLLVYAWSAYDSLHASSNPYMSSGTYQTVCVQTGDSLWSIAARHVDAKDDIRSLITAIKQANNLTNDVAIHPGETLKIPRKNPPAR